MILDTSYFLPLARIGISTDLLLATVENRTTLQMNEMSLSLISIFELQAKAAELKIPFGFAAQSIETILDSFEVKSFSDPKTAELSFEIRETINDYIDCIIVATAVASRENLVTEDTRILDEREHLEKNYGIKIFSYEDMLRS